MIKIFEIYGRDGVWIENKTTSAVQRVDYKDFELDTLDVVNDILRATDIEYECHELPDGDNSDLSAPFYVDRLGDGVNEYKHGIIDACKYATGALHFIHPDHLDPGVYQVVNRFCHAVGAAITLPFKKAEES